MKADFWHQRWQNNEIGFHRDEVNPNLLAYFDVLGLSQGDRVLVPLCGKSKDLLWLAEQGLEVIGVELSDTAVQAFFNENELDAKQESVGLLERWSAGNITIYCGDFFQFSAQHCEGVKAVYDRAALVALPSSMRAEYCWHLIDIVPEPLSLLLVSFDYDQSAMDGPPFSVPASEVRDHFAEVVPIRPLASHDILADETHFQNRGLQQMLEQVYFIGYPRRG